jgi:simple sugar transport system ATP-binding protein
VEDTILELRHIHKSFGNVLALEGVDFHINKGEIIGLVGDNGAGKSTMIKIISGVHAPDSGDIFVRGQKVQSWSVVKAQEAGIETVYQDRALTVQQSITRNIFMGREIQGRLGFIKDQKQHQEAERLMRAIGFTSKVFSPDSVVATLSGGEQQGVAIARALYFHADIIILDEPTTALSLTESGKVFNFVRRIKEEGKSCIFISHNIYHTYNISDRFVVLDRGKIILKTDKKQTTAAQLVKDLQDIARTGKYNGTESLTNAFAQRLEAMN